MSTQIIPYYSVLVIKKKLSFDVKRLKILGKYSYVFRVNIKHQNQKLKQGSWTTFLLLQLSIFPWCFQAYLVAFDFYPCFFRTGQGAVLLASQLVLLLSWIPHPVLPVLRFAFCYAYNIINLFSLKLFKTIVFQYNPWREL